MTNDYKNLENIAKNLLKTHDLDVIEGSLISFYLKKNIINEDIIENEFILKYLTYTSEAVMAYLEIEFDEFPLIVLVNIFELMLERNVVKNNGIVFTPIYIVDHIIDNTIFNITNSNKNFKKIKILDPASGSGIFLIRIIEKIYEFTNFPIEDIIQNNIFGIEINKSNLIRSKLAINMIAIKNGYFNNLNLNIKQFDSLKVDWNYIFNIDGFDFIIGNPPYIKTQNMDNKRVKYLRENFETTKKGGINIFYAFIEHSMKYLSKSGKLSFIIPNNFLVIKSAKELRNYINKNKYLESIIDFTHNMIFKPVMTYNCIIIMSKENNNIIKYKIINKTDDIESKLNDIDYLEMKCNNLDDNRWNFITSDVINNIKKIEQFETKIEKYIKTGIATLKDSVYILKHNDKGGFYVKLENKKYYIENEILRNFYKISNIDKNKKISDSMYRIIFPYFRINNKTEIMREEDIKEKFPICYEYLTVSKDILNTRSSSSIKSLEWYEYGRSQGINVFGKKILFPTFSDKPNFTLDNNKKSLFSNGYAIYENNDIELELLTKIMNSYIVEYYIKNTSYSINGGYYCYQKKYFNNFSIPNFSEEERKYLLKENNKHLIDNFLIEKYKLKF